VILPPDWGTQTRWVAQGDCSPWTPADPYVRALAHTAPRIVGSLINPTPLSVFVSLIRYPKLDVSDVFLKDGSTIRRLAFLHRVDSGGLPRFPRYYRDAPTSCRSSRVASFPSLRGTMVAHDCFRLSRRHRVPNVRPGVLGIAFPMRSSLTWKRQDLSSRQGDLHRLFAHVPGLRQVETTLANSASLARPPFPARQRHPRLVIFRSSIARHPDSLSTLRSAGCPTPRKTRF
jgi:hypothetical protein